MSSSVRVEIEWIIQGVSDRTESHSYAYGTAGNNAQPPQLLASRLWENENETLMKVYKIYGDPALVEVVANGPLLNIIDKGTGKSAISPVFVGRL